MSASTVSNVGIRPRTESELRTYITTYFLPNASESDIDKLLTLYPDDITQGSPFGTGPLNDITPQYKRIAALLGDIVFQSARRFFLENRSSKQNTWSFRQSPSPSILKGPLKLWTIVSKRFKLLPVLGSVRVVVQRMLPETAANKVY